MVLIALAAVKGAASAYKKVKQNEVRNNVIAPLESTAAASAPPDVGPSSSAAPPHASSSAALPPDFSAARAAPFTTPSSIASTPSHVSPPPGAAPAVVDLAAFAPSAKPPPARPASSPENPDAEPAPRRRKPRPAPVDDGSFNHLRRVRSVRVASPTDDTARAKASATANEEKPQGNANERSCEAQLAPVDDGSFNHLRRVRSARVAPSTDDTARAEASAAANEEKPQGNASERSIEAQLATRPTPSDSVAGDERLRRARTARPASMGDVPKDGLGGDASLFKRGSFNHAVQTGAAARVPVKKQTGGGGVAPQGHAAGLASDATGVGGGAQRRGGGGSGERGQGSRGAVAAGLAGKEGDGSTATAERETQRARHRRGSSGGGGGSHAAGSFNALLDNGGAAPARRRN